MVSKIVRYVCDVCSAVFEDEKSAESCESQEVHPYKFDCAENVIIIGGLFPEKVEISEKFRAKDSHKNVYIVNRAIGWVDEDDEVACEEKSMVAEENLISLEEYEKKISEVLKK
ncbi:MAG: hypothetical protein SVJ22_07440 [Halobacteriota archaeon]|nr:hypothetical protein [Halobacteriota archaeon]